MKTPRKLLFLGLILVLAGVWAGKFFGTESAQPATAARVATPASTLAKTIDIKSAMAVAAPKVAPVTPKETPPAEFTPEDKKWVDGNVKAMEQVAKMEGPISQRFLDSAPDDAARARIEQNQKILAASFQRTADLLKNAKPPEDLGEIPLAELSEAKGMQVPANAPRFVLPGGEIFTVSLYYTSWWSLLITEEIPGQTGRFAGQNFNQLAIGQPIILMMHDGALAKFTLQGTMPDAPLDNNRGMGFSGQGARMGRNPAAAGSN